MSTDGKARRPQFRKPRVRLNFSRHVAGAAATGDGPKTRPYMQGYDRELDSEDDETGEGMAFEEQLMLRVPDGPGVHGELDALRMAIRRRSEYNDVWFKFKDSCRAVFHIGQQLYAAKLVDLPCIIESHKTLDNKQIFKIADISQMLLIERPIASESEATASTSTTAKSSNDDYIYPHGITPPMQWARKRRFRKRVHNRSIDTVEKEVEGLLNDDKRADRVEYEFIEPAQADQIEQEIAQQKFRSDMQGAGSDEDDKHDDAASSRTDGDDDDARTRNGRDEDDEDDDDEDDDENVDQDLAAELDAALAREQGGAAQDDESASENDGERASDDDDDARDAHDSDLEDLWDDDDDDDQVDAEENIDDAENKSDKEDDDDDGEEEAERRVRESQLEAECREIESLIKRKQLDIESTMNTLIKSRHQQALRKLQVEHESKKRHLGDIKQIRRTIREERAATAAKNQEHDQAQVSPQGASAGGTLAVPSSSAQESSAKLSTGNAASRKDHNVQ